MISVLPRTRVPRFLLKPAFGTVEVDWGHPLAVGLSFGFLANEGGGGLREIVRSLAPQTRGAVAEPTWTTGPRGLAHYDTYRYYATSADIYNAVTYSCLVALHDQTGNASARRPIIGVWDGLDIDQKAFHLDVDGGNLVNDSFVIAFQGGDSRFTNSIRPAGYHVWGFTMDVGISHSSAFRDGLFIEQAPLEVGSYLNTGNANSYPFVAAPIAASGISASVGWVWLRQLSTGEMQEATANPYAFLRPKIVRYYSFPSGAAATGLAWKLAGYRARLAGVGGLAG